MRNIIDSIKHKKWIHYILITAIGLLASIPLLWVQVRGTHDGWLHLIRLVGLDTSLDMGSSFPYLVAPYLCRDFGYSMMSFYPPLVTYIPYLFGLIAQTFANGLKIFAASTIVLSGICMYNFIYEVTKSKGISFFSAIIYMIFPYHYETIFFRFAIGEFTALIFIPIVFQGLYNLLHGDKKKHFYLTIGATGLILTHTISTIFTAVFCVIYILFNIKKFLDKEVIKKCVINAVFILLISAMFWLPMLEFKSQAEYSIFVPDVMKTAGKYVQTKGLNFESFLRDLEPDGVSFVIGIPLITILLLSVFAYGKINKKHKDLYITFIILGLLAFVMCTKYFPWIILPNVFNTIQYPWRMLGFAFFFWAPVCAINIYYLAKSCKKEWIRNAIFILVILTLGLSTADRFKRYQVTDREQDIKYENILRKDLKISHFSINRDYLPYKALLLQRGYLNEREDRVYVLSGQAIITEEQKEGLEETFNVANVTNGTVLELPYYFYPGYTVILKTNEQEIKLETYESENGFLSIKLPDNCYKGSISVKYTATFLDKTAYIISAISIVGFILYVVIERKKHKKKEGINEK